MKAALILCAFGALLPGAAPGFEASVKKDFHAVAGEYQGLCYDPALPETVHASSCYFSFTVRPSGAVSGRLFLGGHGSEIHSYLDGTGRGISS